MFAFACASWALMGGLFLRYGLESPAARTAEDLSAAGLQEITPQVGEPTVRPFDPGLPGCLESVYLLPRAPFLDYEDPRLLGEHLVVVLKGERRVMVFSDGVVRRVDRAGEAPSCWRAALGVTNQGEHPPGAKGRRGDRKTPEGWYRSSDRPWSRFAPAITIHYPNRADANAAYAAGIIDDEQRDAIHARLDNDQSPSAATGLGGNILFHGGGSARDWTHGCVALNDNDNLELRGALPEDMRTDVLILP
jgi:hypothetical protein